MLLLNLKGCPKTWNAGNPETRKPGNPETWKPGNPETRNSGMTETRKTSPGILKPGITFLRRQKLEQF